MSNSITNIVNSAHKTYPKFSSPFYLFCGIGGAIALGNTQLAPLVKGFLILAIIYQFGQIIEGNVWSPGHLPTDFNNPHYRM
jgi:hypothetical protein